MTTQIDSFKPVIFQVTINGSSFSGNAAPNDGFIDPISVQGYEQIITQTGTVSSPTVNNGDTILLNDVSITFTTAGGLNLAGIVSTINMFTDEHHVIASTSSGKLQLTNAVLYENYGINVMDANYTNGTVTAELGFTNPVIAYPYSAGVDNEADSQAKTRANSRWETLMKHLNFEASVVNVGAVTMVGNAIDTAPSSITFSVTYNEFTNIYTYDETNNNALIKGIPALTRMVARALNDSRIENRQVINPGTQGVPSGGSFVIGPQIQALTVGPVTTDTSASYNAVSVTMISNVR